MGYMARGDQQLFGSAAEDAVVLASWWNGLVSVFLPAICAACDRITLEDAPFCPDCAATLEPIEYACPRCGLPESRAAMRGENMTEGICCLGCVRQPPPWRVGSAGFVFGGALAGAVRRWKFGPRPELTRPLAHLFTPLIDALPATVNALVPVPLHPRRLRMREFNQAGLLARVARRWTHPPVRELLVRTEDTPPQATLDRAARLRNLRYAFRATGRAGITGAHLCVVDDILTTGATLAACSRALHAAGAAQVDVLTLARALP
jgi:ComF family protein